MEDEHLTRDRKIFTKQMLRSFIKNTVSRESWNGAPWIVKPQIAECYHIDTEVPKHLQYGNKAGKKANVSADGENTEAMFGFFASDQRQSKLKAANRGHKVKYSQNQLAKAKEEQYLAYQRALNGDPAFAVSKDERQTPLDDSGEGGTSYFAGLSLVVENASPPPPPIKYPIEDLDIPPQEGPARPALSFVNFDDSEQSLKPDTVGALLETWNTLNVYCEVFQLDSFTFDDYVDALRYASDGVESELLVEIHCAILKTLVNADTDQDGAIQVSLPVLPEEESEDSEESEEEPEEDPHPFRRATRSSTSKIEVVVPKHPAHSKAASPVDAKIHRAAEMFGDYGWIERLRRRDFKNGGWELILVGLFHRLSYRPRLKGTCDEILAQLAPLDEEPTQQTARQQYAALSIDLRAEILRIICMLTLESKAIKNYLEECGVQMTEFRKEKIEAQRARKAS